MLSQTLLVALAGVASANMVVPSPHVVKRAIEARQTDEAGMSACLSAMAALITDMPTAAPAVTDFFVTATGDPCSLSVPPSLKSAYSSYESAVHSWYTAHSVQWSSALAQCPDSDAFTSDLSGSSCTADSGNSGSNGGGSGSKTTDSSDSQETGSGSGSGSKTSSGAGSAAATGGSGNGNGSGNNNNNNGNGNGNAGKNAGHRDTGLAGAAVAIAGVLGAVALL